MASTGVTTTAKDLLAAGSPIPQFPFQRGGILGQRFDGQQLEAIASQLQAVASSTAACSCCSARRRPPARRPQRAAATAGAYVGECAPIVSSSGSGAWSCTMSLCGSLEVRVANDV